MYNMLKLIDMESKSTLSEEIQHVQQQQWISKQVAFSIETY